MCSISLHTIIMDQSSGQKYEYMDDSQNYTVSSDETSFVSPDLHEKIIQVLNGDYVNEFRSTVNIFISGHGSLYTFKHSMIVDFSLACANAQCMCVDCIKF